MASSSSRRIRPLPVAGIAPIGILLIGIALCATVLSVPSPVAAQSISRGEIEGTVRGSGRLLADVSITVTETGTGASLWVESSRGGAFQVPLLPSGEYELLVEARGFYPQLLRDVSMRPGKTIRLNVALRPAAGAVERVDTVAVGAGSSSSFAGGDSRWISRPEIAKLSNRQLGMSGLAALSPRMDEVAGSEGLPGGLSGVLLDGFTFSPAAHPLQAGGQGSLPLLPRIAIGSVDVHNGADVEWTGAAGGYLAATSRPAYRETAGEFFGSGTGGPLWSSEAISPVMKDGMLSAWGGGAAHLPLGSDSARLFIGFEGMRVETPTLSAFSPDLAGRLVDVRSPAGDTQPGDLSNPWIASLQTFSGLARADWSIGEKSRVMSRVSFGTMQDEGGRFFARPLEYGMNAPVDGTDLAAAVSVTTTMSPALSLEIRAGFDRSVREWRGTAGGTDPSVVPTTRFSDPGALLGPDAGLSGRVSRSSVQGGPVAHLRWPGHWVKAGFDVTLPSYDYEHVHRSGGEFLFGNPERLGAGEGVFLRTTGPTTGESFLVPEIGIFVQHRWEPAPGLRLTTGVRLDQERLPTGDVPLNVAWAERTGLLNTAFTSTLNKISPRVGASWDVSGTGATMLHGTLAVHYDQFDPAAFHEVRTLSGAQRQQTQIGNLNGWPALPGGAGTTEQTVLALFGPDLQAPRTARSAFGVSQTLGDRSTFSVSGVLRRTQFMLRRADLNRTLEPSTTQGRPVYGTLRRTGSLVTAEPGSNRRFADFGSVWALNADGWSDYAGVTVSLEHATAERFSLFGSYTFSATDDNLVGARLGVPEAGLRPGFANDGSGGWEDGTSDFDAPHRLVTGLTARIPLLEGLEASALYRVQSGAPYTAGFRAGVDVNGDGSGYNDPAFVPEMAASRFPCLSADVGRFATRNGCRSVAMHALDLHFSLGIFRVGPSLAALTLDLFNLMDTEMGRPDNALFLVDDQGVPSNFPQPDVIVYQPNEAFGQVTPPVRTGRMARIGFKVALP